MPKLFVIVLVLGLVSGCGEKSIQVKSESVSKELDGKKEVVVSSEPSVPPHRAAQLISAIPTIVPAKGYVGSESCVSCHSEEHKSWHYSYHRTMTQPINEATAPEAIKGDQTIDVEGETFRFEQTNGEFFIRMIRKPNGLPHLSRLVMMTGSHHMHAFWYEQVGVPKTPKLLPYTYLIDQDRWIHRRSAFVCPPELEYDLDAGRWNTTCIHCHSTHPRLHVTSGVDINDSRVWNSEVVDFGISCEACHGPGEQHIQIHNEAKPNDGFDHIVDPMKLDTQEQRDICARCHSIGFSKPLNQKAFYNDGAAFRPGKVNKEVNEYRVVRMSREHLRSPDLAEWLSIEGRMAPSDHFWPDGQTRVSGRAYNGMIESKCAQESDMTCLTCHTMHQSDEDLMEEWRDDQLKPGMRGDESCFQCHESYRELGSKHTHHPIESTGSRCANCHMPHTVYGLLKTIRSHTISSPSALSVVQTTRPSACNLCHLDQSLGETADHLANWYGQEPPTMTKLEETLSLSVLQLLMGDASQRVLQVAAMERAEARNASGTDWLRPYLLIGLSDTYDAIRLISERVYDSLPNTEPLSFDYSTPVDERMRLIDELLGEIREHEHFAPNGKLLVDEDGKIDIERIHRLMKFRNQRPVTLQE